MAASGKLLMQAVHLAVGDVQHLVQALAAFQQATVLEHHRRFDHRRVEVVVLQATQPGTCNRRIAARFAAGDGMNLLGMANEVIVLH